MPVHIAHIHKHFGKQHVLKDISLDIQDGEIVGLLGPNGAGKSTLMKIMVGLWQADSGEINVPKEHGYLPEQNPLYEEMYVREYLEFMSRIGGLTQAETESIVPTLIERTGLQPEQHKRISQLSKGYRQRVGIAQALIGNPNLLILDEPTTGLDPNQLEDIRALIRQEGQHRTIILSTHILQEVSEMCSRIIIIDHGEIKADVKTQEAGDLAELFRQKTKDGRI